MPSQPPVAGLNNVGSYQVSLQPWARSNIEVPDSGSVETTPIEIKFPKVTGFVTIKNDGATDLRVGFAARGLVQTDNYFVIESGSSYTGEWKLTRLYLMTNTNAGGTGSVVAGLTNIETDRLDLANGTGSKLFPSWSGSEGVG